MAEIVGPLSSGRTSLLVQCLARATRGGGVAALVDVDHALDPHSAARAGVPLSRVLWVRCEGRRRVALRAVDLLVRCPGFALVVLDAGARSPRLTLAEAYRLRLAVRRSGTTLLLVGCLRVAGPAAAVVVSTARGQAAWYGAAAVTTRLAGVRTRVQMIRKQGAGGPGGSTFFDDRLWWSA